MHFAYVLTGKNYPSPFFTALLIELLHSSGYSNAITKQKNSTHRCTKFLKKYYEKLRQHSRDSGSLVKYLLFDNKIDADTLISIRIVYADLEHAFIPRRDTDHHKSSDNSITLHMNAWELCS